MRFILALLLASAAIASWAADSEPAKIAVTPIQVSDHAYYVQGQAGVASIANEGFNSNAGFVVTDDGVVVIDALGTPALGKAFIDAIRTVTNKPIKRVILTHYHADHFYGLQAFKEIGAEVWAHRDGRLYLEGEEGAQRLAQRRQDLFPWVNEKTKMIPADRWLNGDIAFTMGGLHFEIIHMGPAHSPDDEVIAVREDQVIFSGDIIFTGRIPFVGNADSKRWLATMDRLLQMKPKTMVTGHGKVSTDPAKDLLLTKDYLTYLRQTMGKAVDDFTPFEEAYKQTDWSRFEKIPAFDAANRINAYSTYLLMEKEALSR